LAGERASKRASINWHGDQARTLEDVRGRAAKIKLQYQGGPLQQDLGIRVRGVFGGFGGSKVSDFAVKKLPAELCLGQVSHDSTNEPIRKAFQSLDRDCACDLSRQQRRPFGARSTRVGMQQNPGAGPPEGRGLVVLDQIANGDTLDKDESMLESTIKAKDVKPTGRVVPVEEKVPKIRIETGQADKLKGQRIIVSPDAGQVSSSADPITITEEDGRMSHNGLFKLAQNMDEDVRKIEVETLIHGSKFLGNMGLSEQLNVTVISVATSTMMKELQTSAPPMASTPIIGDSRSGQLVENPMGVQHESITGQPLAIRVDNSELMAAENRMMEDQQQFILDQVAIAGLEDGINEMVVDETERVVLRGFKNVNQIKQAYKNMDEDVKKIEIETLIHGSKFQDIGDKSCGQCQSNQILDVSRVDPSIKVAAGDKKFRQFFHSVERLAPAEIKARIKSGELVRGVVYLSRVNFQEGSVNGGALEGPETLLAATKDERTKRRKYVKYTSDLRDEIAEYAQKYGTFEASKHYAMTLGNPVTETTVRDFVEACQLEEQVGGHAYLLGLDACLKVYSGEMQIGVDLHRSMIQRMRVKSRLLHEGPFSVVLYLQEFKQMGKAHMEETLRCPKIYILGDRENYGISRLSRANVERVDKKIQTRPVVPMPLRVFQEICTRVPYVHEWYVLGLSHPINHPEWEGKFANKFGGSKVSDFAVKKLPAELCLGQVSHDSTNEPIREAFQSLDREYFDLVLNMDEDMKKIEVETLIHGSKFQDIGDKSCGQCRSNQILDVSKVDPSIKVAARDKKFRRCFHNGREYEYDSWIFENAAAPFVALKTMGIIMKDSNMADRLSRKGDSKLELNKRFLFPERLAPEEIKVRIKSGKLVRGVFYLSRILEDGGYDPGDTLEKDKSMLESAIKAKNVQPTGKVVGIIRRKWRQYCGMLQENPSGSGATVHIFVPVLEKMPKIRIETRQAANLKGQRIIVSQDAGQVSSSADPITITEKKKSGDFLAGGGASINCSRDPSQQQQPQQRPQQDEKQVSMQRNRFKTEEYDVLNTQWSAQVPIQDARKMRTEECLPKMPPWETFNRGSNSRFQDIGDKSCGQCRSNQILDVSKVDPSIKVAAGDKKLPLEEKKRSAFKFGACYRGLKGVHTFDDKFSIHKHEELVTLLKTWAKVSIDLKRVGKLLIPLYQMQDSQDTEDQDKAGGDVGSGSTANDKVDEDQASSPVQEKVPKIKSQEVNKKKSEDFVAEGSDLIKWHRRNTTGWVAQHRSHPEEYKYQDCPSMVKKHEKEFLATKQLRKECDDWSQGPKVPHPCKKCGVFDHRTHECGMIGACCRYCGRENHLVIVCPLLHQVCTTCKTMVGHSSECHKDSYGLDMSDLRDRAQLYLDRGFLTRRLKDVTKAYEVKFLDRGVNQLESLPRQEAMIKMAQAGRPQL
jgi:hypothetical protein